MQLRTVDTVLAAATFHAVAAVTLVTAILDVYIRFVHDYRITHAHSQIARKTRFGARCIIGLQGP